MSTVLCMINVSANNVVIYEHIIPKPIISNYEVNVNISLANKIINKSFGIVNRGLSSDQFHKTIINGFLAAS